MKRKLGLLRQLSLTANPSFGVDVTIGRFMERLLAFYNAKTCVLIMTAGSGENYQLRRATRRFPDQGSHAVDIGLAEDCPLLKVPGDHMAVYRRPAWSLMDGQTYRVYDFLRQKTVGWDFNCAANLAEWLDARSFIIVPMRCREKNLGRLCIASNRLSAFKRESAVFLLQAVDQFIPIIENIRLVDRMASEAAEQERRRLARCIHDRVIQPYLGLQMGVSAVQQALQSELGQESGGASLPKRANHVELLERLSTMTRDGIEALRECVYGLRQPKASKLVDSIRNFASQYSDVSGIVVTVVERIAHVELNDRLASEVFQTVIEALSNVRKHTEANRVCIYLETSDDVLIVRCENDGSAASPKFHPASIADRADALGGRVEVSCEDGCTRVQVEIPL